MRFLVIQENEGGYDRWLADTGTDHDIQKLIETIPHHDYEGNQKIVSQVREWAMNPRVGQVFDIGKIIIVRILGDIKVLGGSSGVEPDIASIRAAAAHQIYDFVLVYEDDSRKIVREIVRAYTADHARARFRSYGSTIHHGQRTEARLIDIEPYDPSNPRHNDLPHRDRPRP